MKNMKKILVLALAALLLVAVSVAGTVAYLTAKTDPVTNTFKPSTLSVTLSEETPASNNRNIQMVPGTSVTKDPKVSYTTDVPAYVFVKVTETIGGDLIFDTYIGYDVITTGDNKWTRLEDGLYYMEVAAGSQNNISIIQDKTTPTPKADKVTIKNVTLTEMEALKKLEETAYPKLTFEAFIIQKEPFGSAAAAWAEVPTTTTP